MATCIPALAGYLLPVFSSDNGTGPGFDYTDSLNLNSKVLDFIKSGGPAKAEIANVSLGVRDMRKVPISPG